VRQHRENACQAAQRRHRTVLMARPAQPRPAPPSGKRADESSSSRSSSGPRAGTPSVPAFGDPTGAAAGPLPVSCTLSSSVLDVRLIYPLWTHPKRRHCAAQVVITRQHCAAWTQPMWQYCAARADYQKVASSPPQTSPEGNAGKHRHRCDDSAPRTA
jgi:hypothetical protein